MLASGRLLADRSTSFRVFTSKRAPPATASNLARLKTSPSQATRTSVELSRPRLAMLAACRSHRAENASDDLAHPLSESERKGGLRWMRTALLGRVWDVRDLEERWASHCAFEVHGEPRCGLLKL